MPLPAKIITKPLTWRTSAKLIEGLRDGLVAEYLFFEGHGRVLHDTSGYGNNGTIYGARWVRMGRKYMLYFDGEHDYAEVPNSSVLTIAGPLSVEAVAYPINYVHYPYQNIVVTKGVGPTLNYRLNYYSNGWEFRICLAGEVRILHVDEPVGKWYHLVGVYDGSEMKLYIDGSLLGTLSISGTPATSTEPLVIGWGEVVTAPEHFYGYISLIRIWRRALSDDEVSQLYNLARAMVPGL